MKRCLITTICLLGLSVLHAQDVKQDSLDTPPINYFRAEEDYSYLKYKNSDSIHVVQNKFDPIKFAPLDRKKNIWISFGGQYRPRFEYFNHQFLKETNKSSGYYSHRIALNTSLNFTKNFRIYSEFYHGLLTKKGDTPVQDDPLALHQLFMESKINLGNTKLSLRIGRQEMSYGISRLVGMREGPNIRLSFDALRFKFEKNTTSIHAFYGKEVLPNFDVFKDKRNEKMDFWGVYSTFFIKNGNGFTDLYYFGLEREHLINPIDSGKETRHTTGIRMSGKNGLNINYNTELIYQFGTFDNKDISSFAAEFDYNYVFTEKKYKPTFGIKLDYIMGDKNRNDDKINTFNSLFTNPTYFGLSSTIAPSNLFDIHPSIKLNFTDKISAGLNWDFLWRASTDDGIYAPAGFLLFPGDANKHRFIGQELGINAFWFFDRHLNFSGEFSYLIPGKFIKEQGGSRLTYFSITASYKI